MRVRTAFLYACVSLVVSSPFLASAEAPASCAVFTRNLKMGMTGSDVKALQVFLNANTKTRIALSGLGSPGNESTYFGKKTMLALASFQDLYAGEVLTPAGLTKGNGYLGSLSRAKITALCTPDTGKGSRKAPTSQTVKPTTPSTTPPVPPPAKSSTQQSGQVSLGASALLDSMVGDPNAPIPYIMYLGDRTVKTGSELVVFGGGFTKTGNTILLGANAYGGLSLLQDGTLRVKLPASASTGRFLVKVKNSKGESSGTYVVVTSPNASVPIIKKVSPQMAEVGTVVTLTGENFSKTGNTVMFGSEEIKGIGSADGKTMTFVARAPVATDEEVLPEERIVDNVSFSVLNENGVSELAVIKMRF